MEKSHQAIKNTMATNSHKKETKAIALILFH